MDVMKVFKHPWMRLLARIGLIIILIASNFLLVLILLGFYQRYLFLIPYGLLVLGLVALLTKLDLIGQQEDTACTLSSFAGYHLVLTLFGSLHILLLAIRWLGTAERGERWIPELMMLGFMALFFGLYFLKRSGKLARSLSLVTFLANLLGYLTIAASALYFFGVSMNG